MLSTSPRKSNDGDLKCLICFENESGYVLMNCGHGIYIYIYIQYKVDYV